MPLTTSNIGFGNFSSPVISLPKRTEDTLVHESVAATIACDSPVCDSVLEEDLAEQSPSVAVAENVSHQTPTVDVWGLDFHAVTMEQSLELLDVHIQRRSPGIAITANLNYLMLCDEYDRLQSITRDAALVLCDGMPIVWWSWLNAWRKGSVRLPARVAGSDLIYRLSALAAERGYRLFLIGGAEGIAQCAADRLVALYPGLQIAGVECPPFRPWTEDEERNMVKRIRDARADILFVAFGQPKGEFWIADHLADLQVPLCMQLGASFDFVTGNARRAPKFLQAIGMEWLYRALRDPRRLVPRYWKNFCFLIRAVVRDLRSR